MCSNASGRLQYIGLYHRPSVHVSLTRMLSDFYRYSTLWKWHTFRRGTRYPKAGVQKFSINLGAISLHERSVRDNTFQTEGPCTSILGDPLQNLNATATWCPGFVHPCPKGLICEEPSLLYKALCRIQWPRGLRRGSAAARLLRFWVWIPPGAWMTVCCECCVLSCKGLCEGLITRPEESYRLWWVVGCDLETLGIRRPCPNGGRGVSDQIKI